MHTGTHMHIYTRKHTKKTKSTLRDTESPRQCPWLLVGAGWPVCRVAVPGEPSRWVWLRYSTHVSGTLAAFSQREPGIETEPCPANTSFSFAGRLSGSIQKTHQGSVPMQKVLVGAHLCDGPIVQHQDLVSLGQDVQRVCYKDPSLGREGQKLHMLECPQVREWECLYLCTCTSGEYHTYPKRIGRVSQTQKK